MLQLALFRRCVIIAAAIVVKFLALHPPTWIQSFEGLLEEKWPAFQRQVAHHSRVDKVEPWDERPFFICIGDLEAKIERNTTWLDGTDISTDYFSLRMHVCDIDRPDPSASSDVIEGRSMGAKKSALSNVTRIAW